MDYCFWGFFAAARILLIFWCLCVSPQGIIYRVHKALHLCHQPLPHTHTSSTRPSRPWAEAHWPIRGARALRPQPAWRPTCRVRQNASSCRTAGSWAAMWPWRAGEWPTMTYSGGGKFKSRCLRWGNFHWLRKQNDPEKNEQRHF